MKIKEHNKKKDDFFIMDTVKNYTRDDTAKTFFGSQEEYDKHILEYYKINKAANCISKYEILKEC